VLGTIRAIGSRGTSLNVGQNPMGLDAVELILAWEESFGISISDAEAQTMFTTRQVAECIYEKVRSDMPEDKGCISMRAFFRLRQAFCCQGVSRSEVRLESKVSALLPSRNRRDILSTIGLSAGFAPHKPTPFNLQFTFGRVRDMVTDAVICHHNVLRLPGCGWSRRQVREVVRAVMFTQLALRRFSDDALIVKDLGVD